MDFLANPILLFEGVECVRWLLLPLFRNCKNRKLLFMWDPVHIWGPGFRVSTFLPFSLGILHICVWIPCSVTSEAICDPGWGVPDWRSWCGTPWPRRVLMEASGKLALRLHLCWYVLWQSHTTTEPVLKHSEQIQCLPHFSSPSCGCGVSILPPRGAPITQ